MMFPRYTKVRRKLKTNSEVYIEGVVLADTFSLEMTKRFTVVQDAHDQVWISDGWERIADKAAPKDGKT